MNIKTRNWRRPFVVSLQAFILASTLTGCREAEHVIFNGVGHEISADIEGTHSIDAQLTQAVISSQFGKVTVERSRVRVDESQWVAIREDVPVTVRLFEHKLTINAGRVSIARTIR
jgi:hypothetical protein